MVSWGIGGVNSLAQRIGGSGIRCRNEWEVEGQDLARYDRFLGGEFSFQEQRRERLRQFLPLAGDSIPPRTPPSTRCSRSILRTTSKPGPHFPTPCPPCSTCAPSVSRLVSLPTGITSSKSPRSGESALSGSLTGSSAQSSLVSPSRTQGPSCYPAAAWMCSRQRP